MVTKSYVKYKLILDSKLGASIYSSSPSKVANKALPIDFLNATFGWLHTCDGRQFHAFAPKHEKEFCCWFKCENWIWYLLQDAALVL